MKYSVSLGFQAGRITPDSRFYVVHKGELYGLSYLTYRMWRIFQNVSTYPQVTNELGMSGDINSTETKRSFDELKEAGLIVPLRDVAKCIPYREGRGVGYDTSTKSYLIDCGTKITIPFLSYMIWCHSDGEKNVHEVMEALSKHKVDFQERDFFRGLIFLLKTDALILL